MSERFDFRERLKPVPWREPATPILDDLRELWACIRHNPLSHAFVASAGLIAGCLFVIAPALVWSWFL